MGNHIYPSLYVYAIGYIKPPLVPILSVYQLSSVPGNPIFILNFIDITLNPYSTITNSYPLRVP